MKKIINSKTSGMPMLEIVITIGIFAIISIFLLQMFLSSHALQEKSEDVGKSILKAENIAETIKSTSSIEQAVEQLNLQEAFISIEEKENTYILNGIYREQMSGATKAYITYYDKNWKIQKEGEKAKYCGMIIKNETEKNLEEVDIFFFHLGSYALLNEGKRNTLLYHLYTANYKRQ